jgi:hypothetical protein
VIPFVPDWLTYEIENALQQIKPPWLAKKRATVLRLAEGTVVGRSMAETFALSDTCSETTWYGRHKHGKRKKGWKDDKAIVGALEMAVRRALAWEDRRIGRGIAAAREKLAQEALPSIERMAQLRDGAEDEGLRLAAALSIYDRAEGIPAAQMIERLVCNEDDLSAQENGG